MRIHTQYLPLNITLDIKYQSAINQLKNIDRATYGDAFIEGILIVVTPFVTFGIFIANTILSIFLILLLLSTAMYKAFLGMRNTYGKR